MKKLKISNAELQITSAPAGKTKSTRRNAARSRREVAEKMNIDEREAAEKSRALQKGESNPPSTYPTSRQPLHSL